ncbi:phage holin family protein [Chromobacterium violaceum]|nr:phage holin family protein [Chromobacterium violaceum]
MQRCVVNRRKGGIALHLFGIVGLAWHGDGEMMGFIKPSDAQIFTWALIGGFSAWGGVVRYIIDVQGRQKKWNIFGVFSQVIVSGFTGLLGGLLGFESERSYYITLAIAGLFGAMGNTAFKLYLAENS